MGGDGRVPRGDKKIVERALCTGTVVKLRHRPVPRPPKLDTAPPHSHGAGAGREGAGSLGRQVRGDEEGKLIPIAVARDICDILSFDLARQRVYVYTRMYVYSLCAPGLFRSAESTDVLL